jgi:hypothetical protein
MTYMLLASNLFHSGLKREVEEFLVGGMAGVGVSDCRVQARS